MKNINNLYNNFRAILCLNGDLPEIDFFIQNKNTILVAADGPLPKLIEMGLEPDYIIGDLDSIDIKDYKDKFNPEQIIQLIEQDSNDFEKALKFLISKNIKEICIVGINGGDYEHSLNNWSVFIRYSKQLNLIIYHNYRIGIAVFESLIFETKPNEIISIIPQPIARIKTSGLNWNLNDEILEFGIREGARNFAIGNSVEIEVLSGSFILFKSIY